ncbi:exonuclease domain-containing protein [Galbitalea sp. SE-J8]|uniref:exonuclease domain-containing protein n=1 Tax=Galbitalea sp. SE-J8 TaxID=3054952 RepID=UPI00259CA70D|nr:exonuclease domain-containing protein [Galbitalea sp. SE-J8]MDM4763144.1 exonuclease domain-containing protein [Galbitalea sp. SE-J8]
MSSAWHETLAVFDLETTGIDTESARIVSAHVGVIGPDGDVLERREWLADPGVEIPEGAAAVHGISTERARAEGRPSGQVVVEILDALADVLDRGLPVAIYNAPYDLTLLDREARRHGVLPLDGPAPIVDPLIIDKTFDRYRPGKRTLTATAALYRVELLDAHDAGADAVAAGRVAQALARAFPEQLAMTALELHERQVRWAYASSRSFEDYRRRTDPEFTTRHTWPLHPFVAQPTLAGLEAFDVA